MQNHMADRMAIIFAYAACTFRWDNTILDLAEASVKSMMRIDDKRTSENCAAKRFLQPADWTCSKSSKNEHYTQHCRKQRDYSSLASNMIWFGRESSLRFARCVECTVLNLYIELEREKCTLFIDQLLCHNYCRCRFAMWNTRAKSHQSSANDSTMKSSIIIMIGKFIATADCAWFGKALVNFSLQSVRFR